MAQSARSRSRPGLKNFGNGNIQPYNNFGGVTPGATFGQYDRPTASPMADFVPDVPGIGAGEKMLRYSQDPDAYMKAYFDSRGLTPEYKNAFAAANGDSMLAARMVAGRLAKERTIEERPGAIAYDPMTGATLSNPNDRGVATGFGPDGRPYQYNAQVPQGAMANAPPPRGYPPPPATNPDTLDQQAPQSPAINGPPTDGAPPSMQGQTSGYPIGVPQTGAMRSGAAPLPASGRPVRYSRDDVINEMRRRGWR